MPWSSKTRQVRLILLEYIPGLSMKQFNPSKIPQDIRKKVMKKVIDVESLVYKRDVLLREVWPQNVIITETEFPRDIHLVFVGFHRALFQRGKLEGSEDRRDLHLGEYITPLVRWAELNDVWNFLKWIDWDWTPWIQSEYRHEEHLATSELKALY
ncbi:hypothetical protein TRVA0_032S01398 [Trichomonascus vanleenenianus]|uniref:uncharacterized protein n=1 Tax=Trichomonascus vanleenenianus TaxID=2268995 RepID=UPI003ECACCA5